MIYTITLMNQISYDDFTNLPTFGEKYCIGYFSSLKDAFSEIDNLYTPYKYCIIEAIPEGIYEESKIRFLYELKNNTYTLIAEPKPMSEVRNFSIG